MSKSLTIHHYDTLERHPDTSVPDPHQDTFSKTVLGFWIYLMTDCLLFASFFAAFAVLHHETFGGPSSRELFSLSHTFAETMVLLFSSVTCGMAMLASLKKKTTYQVLPWLAVTFLLGASFLTLELKEFSHLVNEGNSWTRSAFLTSFFSLVGTHGLHITVGLLWMIVIMAQVALKGITVITFRRLIIFSLFWHFLDVIWVFIFTFVYLMGVI